ERRKKGEKVREEKENREAEPAENARECGRIRRRNAVRRDRAVFRALHPRVDVAIDHVISGAGACDDKREAEKHGGKAQEIEGVGCGKKESCRCGHRVAPYDARLYERVIGPDHFNSFCGPTMPFTYRSFKVGEGIWRCSRFCMIHSVPMTTIPTMTNVNANTMRF